MGALNQVPQNDRGEGVAGFPSNFLPCGFHLRLDL